MVVRCVGGEVFYDLMIKCQSFERRSLRTHLNHVLSHFFHPLRRSLEGAELDNCCLLGR